MAFKRIRNIGETVLSNGWTKLSSYDFEFERRNGEWMQQKREVYKRSPAAAIIPYNPANGTVILTRQLRFPVYAAGENPMLLEACAGLIDEGETPEIAIIREGEEELGLRLKNVTFITSAYSSPGNSTEKIYLFIATYNANDHIGPGGGLFSEGEDIEVIEMPLELALAMVERGEIADLKTLFLLGICKTKFIG